jgi:hypothetical protein
MLLLLILYVVPSFHQIVYTVVCIYPLNKPLLTIWIYEYMLKLNLFEPQYTHT